MGRNTVGMLEGIEKALPGMVWSVGPLPYTVQQLWWWWAETESVAS